MLNIILVLSLTQWVTYARVVRGGTLSVKAMEFVLAAKALGFRNSRIMARYVLPNVFAPVIVIATFSVAQTIVAESALSFLGLGVPPLIPSWGGMLADGRTYLVVAWRLFGALPKPKPRAAANKPPDVRLDERIPAIASTSGCAFVPRCTRASDICSTRAPALEQLQKDHRVAYFKAGAGHANDG